MSMKVLRRILFTVSTVVLTSLPASGQGGWRQWDLHLLDGTTVQANPLGLKDGRFTHSMSNDEKGIERAKISYISAVSNSLPRAPTLNSKKDLIVFLDGNRSQGSVIFKEIKFSEGTIVQNGKELTLEKVAYIIFAKLKKRPGN